MSGQDFEVGVRFNNLGERRNSVSPIGSLMRKFPDPWEKRPHKGPRWTVENMGWSMCRGHKTIKEDEETAKVFYKSSYRACILSCRHLGVNSNFKKRDRHLSFLGEVNSVGCEKKDLICLEIKMD